MGGQPDPAPPPHPGAGQPGGHWGQDQPRASGTSLGMGQCWPGMWVGPMAGQDRAVGSWRPASLGQGQVAPGS